MKALTLLNVKRSSIPITVSLRDKSYSDGTGEGLTAILKRQCQNQDSNDKFIKFLSYGATVMSRSDKGVKARLVEINIHLVHIHCIDHKIALHK